jgi:hypothetical protein
LSRLRAEVFHRLRLKPARPPAKLFRREGNWCLGKAGTKAGRLVQAGFSTPLATLLSMIPLEIA